MDCNSYSYAPHILEEGPRKIKQHTSAKIEKRGTFFVVIFEDESWNKFFDIGQALAFVREMIE